MKIEENPRVTAWAIRNMKTKMGQRERDGLPHASDLFACFRKSILNRRDPQEPTDDDIVRFAVGFAMQEWFFGPEKDGEEHWGIILSADHFIKGQVFEFKTTRKSYESLPKDPATGKGIKGAEKVRFDPAEAGDWVPRSLAYMAAKGVTKAHIMVFFLFQNMMSTWTITATKEELKEVRADLEARRDVFNEYLEEEELPSIETRSGDWECGYCPFYDKYCFHELTAAGVKVRRFD